MPGLQCIAFPLSIASRWGSFHVTDQKTCVLLSLYKPVLNCDSDMWFLHFCCTHPSILDRPCLSEASQNLLGDLIVFLHVNVRGGLTRPLLRCFFLLICDWEATHYWPSVCLRTALLHTNISSIMTTYNIAINVPDLCDLRGSVGDLWGCLISPWWTGISTD